MSIGVLAVTSIFVTKSIQREADSWQWVVHTREVLERLQMVLTSINSAEAAQRGFLVSGAEEHFAAYRQEAEAVPEEVDRLHALTADNPGQQKRIQELRLLIAQRVSLLENVLQLKLQGVEIDPALLESGRQQKAAIVGRAGAIRAEEQRLLQERQSRVERARQELVIAVGAVFALSFGLLILLRTLAERDAARLRLESEQLRTARLQLLEANQMLEQRVQERTEQITEANAELQGFAHTVAHDLRAPLRNVEGFAAALLEDESERLSEEGKLFTSRIQAAVARMDRLITDLLAYSHLSRSELQLRQVDVGRVMQTVQRDLEAQINETGARITIEEPMPRVWANEGMLVQVLANLLSNALKFVAPGKHPQVHISTVAVSGKARILIADNGIGIDPVHRERIFRVFERLHGQEQYPGTGIGLAIVKKAIERMGGTVEVDNVLEGGTRFAIELPVAPRSNG
ncbi:MAG TPA: CHASE3 domain-containing protein [Noviherbaspirillum sp.]|uniref:sensor histidine kinase n=1 Tax=Noviherbaspirillum sp. TaxID=1926288 RepID=UPI002F93C8DE